jgi:hypothetical protein
MLVLTGIWAGLVGLLIAAGQVVTHSAAMTHFDQHATGVVVSWRTPALDSAMRAVTWLGSWVAVLVTAVIMATLIITRHLSVLAGVVAVFAWAGEAGGVAIGKAVVGRRRPPRPSGWSMRAAGRFPPATPPRHAWLSRSWRCASPRSPAAGRRR